MSFQEVSLDLETGTTKVNSGKQKSGCASPRLSPKREGLRGGIIKSCSGEEDRICVGDSCCQEVFTPGSELHLHTRKRQRDVSDGTDQNADRFAGNSSPVDIDISNSVGTCLKIQPRRLTFDNVSCLYKTVNGQKLVNSDAVPSPREKRKAMASPRREPRTKSLRSEQEENLASGNALSVRVTRQSTTVIEQFTPAVAESFNMLSTDKDDIQVVNKRLSGRNLIKDLEKTSTKDTSDLEEEPSTERGQRSRGTTRQWNSVAAKVNGILSQEVKIDTGRANKAQIQAAFKLGSSDLADDRPKIITSAPVEEEAVSNAPLKTCEECSRKDVADASKPFEQVEGLLKAQSDDTPKKRPVGRPRKRPVVIATEVKVSALDRDHPEPGSAAADENGKGRTTSALVDSPDKGLKRSRGRPRKVRGDPCQLPDVTNPAVSFKETSFREHPEMQQKISTENLLGTPLSARRMSENSDSIRPIALDKEDSRKELPGATPDAVDTTLKRSRGRPRKAQTVKTEEIKDICPNSLDTKFKASQEEQSTIQTTGLTVTADREELNQPLGPGQNSSPVQYPPNPTLCAVAEEEHKGNKLVSSIISSRVEVATKRVGRPSKAGGKRVVKPRRNQGAEDGNEKSGTKRPGRPRKCLAEYGVDGLKPGQNCPPIYNPLNPTLCAVAEQHKSVSSITVSRAEAATKLVGRPSKGGDKKVVKPRRSQDMEDRRENSGLKKRPGRPRKFPAEYGVEALKHVPETQGERVQVVSNFAASLRETSSNKRAITSSQTKVETNTKKAVSRRGRPRKELVGTNKTGLKEILGKAAGRRRPADGQSKSGVKVTGAPAKEIAGRHYLTKVLFDGVEFRVGEDVYVRKSECSCSESETEVEECQVCGKVDNNTLIECDKCLSGFHLTCLVPHLEEVPEDDWVCSYCENGEDPPLKLGNKNGKQRSAREMLLAGGLWAARIEKIWKEGDDSYWFRARWFVVPEETSMGRQKHTGSREVFRSNQTDNNGMESILRHCYVMSPDDYKKSAHEGDDVFFCEYEYNERWCRFKRIDYENARVDDSDDEAYEPSDESEDEGFDGKEDGTRKWRPEKERPKQMSTLKAANKRQSFSGGIEQVGAKQIIDRPKKGPQTDFDKAKSALTLSAVPPSMPCRETERKEVSAFLKDAVAAGEQCLGRCLYISGVPGTGKTATVREVIKELESKVDAGELPAFRFLEINGLRLPSPDHLYTVLHEAFTGQHLGWRKALECLDNRFANAKRLSGADARPCVLLIDELDVLVNRSQSVLYNIFDWPSRLHARLVVIGIANTMDLPERMLPRIASRMGMKRISFSPYSHKQLEEIIAARLEGVRIFDKQAAEFASRKVAAVSGDIRRALELCRRAVELAEARAAGSMSSNPGADIQGRNGHDPNQGSNSDPQVSQAVRHSVTMADVDAAISQLFEAPQIQMMQRSSKLAKIFLVAMVCEQRRSSLVETTFKQVAATCSELCANNGEDSPDFDTLLAVGCKLGALRIVLCEPGARHKLQKLQLNFPCDDVTFALKKDELVPWLVKYL